VSTNVTLPGASLPGIAVAKSMLRSASSFWKVAFSSRTEREWALKKNADSRRAIHFK
jgi:hypothetical protein